MYNAYILNKKLEGSSHIINEIQETNAIKNKENYWTLIR